MLVFVLFGLPLFFGLQTFDMETDEAFYSYSIDRILEVGDWLQPKYSPSEAQPFLEKPPLKFWIVAAPIKAGLMPWNEFGLRFWDALFGSIGFLYTFAIGVMMAGPICGFAAVMLLFTHWPLVLDHGLLTNNMEGPLFLCYCGGLYHFLRWAKSPARDGRRHAYAVGLYFVLGFMTKFVAAIFLPAIVVAASWLHAPTRRKLLGEWTLWARVIGVALALILPWFIYAQVQFGNELWQVMLKDHIYTRFTASLDPNHLHPWNYYFAQLMAHLNDAHVLWLVLTGVVILAVRLVREWRLVDITVFGWIVPLVLISSGSSKLYHYTYPFLPPVMLCGGLLLGLFVEWVPRYLHGWGVIAEQGLHGAVPSLERVARKRPVSAAITGLLWIASALTIGTIAFGYVHLSIGSTMLLKNGSVIRPLLVIAVLALLARRAARVALLIVLLSVAAVLPAEAYRGMLVRIREPHHHPMIDARQCILQVQDQLVMEQQGVAKPGLYVDSATEYGMWHPIFYNFRRIQPWTREEAPSPARLDRMLHEPSAMRPSLVWDARYQEYLRGPEGARFAQDPRPGELKLLQYVLLLPGPYAACATGGVKP